METLYIFQHMTEITYTKHERWQKDLSKRNLPVKIFLSNVYGIFLTKRFSVRNFGFGFSWTLFLSFYFYFRRLRSSKLLNWSSRAFREEAVAREKDKVLDSYPAWILEGRTLPVPLPPPPLDETRRLETRLSLGPPAELGRELRVAATAFLEVDVLCLEELLGLSESPRCQKQTRVKSLSNYSFWSMGAGYSGKKDTFLTKCLVKGPSSEFLDLEWSRGVEEFVGCLLEKASTAPEILFVSFPKQKSWKLSVRNEYLWLSDFQQKQGGDLRFCLVYPLKDLR